MTFPRISVNKSSKLTKQLLSTSLSELLHNIFLRLCEETENTRLEGDKEEGNVFNTGYFSKL